MSGKRVRIGGSVVGRFFILVVLMVCLVEGEASDEVAVEQVEGRE